MKTVLSIIWGALKSSCVSKSAFFLMNWKCKWKFNLYFSPIKTYTCREIWNNGGLSRRSEIATGSFWTLPPKMTCISHLGHCFVVFLQLKWCKKYIFADLKFKKRARRVSLPDENIVPVKLFFFAWKSSFIDQNRLPFFFVFSER